MPRGLAMLQRHTEETSVSEARGMQHEDNSENKEEAARSRPIAQGRIVHEAE